MKEGARDFGAWYDEATGSIWVIALGELLKLPLDPNVYFDRACTFVGRDLTQAEWDRFVPGGGEVQSACADRP